jgi:hypothetical protein
LLLPNFGFYGIIFINSRCHGTVVTVYCAVYRWLVSDHLLFRDFEPYVIHDVCVCVAITVAMVMLLLRDFGHHGILPVTCIYVYYVTFDHHS